MIKIKVSYENDRDLIALMSRLKPNILSYKIPEKYKGQYKKAYIEKGGQKLPFFLCKTTLME